MPKKYLPLFLVSAFAGLIWFAGAIIGLIILGYQMGVWIQTGFNDFPGPSLREILIALSHTNFRTIVLVVVENLSIAKLPDFILDSPVWLIICGPTGLLAIPVLWLGNLQQRSLDAISQKFKDIQELARSHNQNGDSSK